MENALVVAILHNADEIEHDLLGIVLLPLLLDQLVQVALVQIEYERHLARRLIDGVQGDDAFIISHAQQCLDLGIDLMLD